VLQPASAASAWALSAPWQGAALKPVPWIATGRDWKPSALFPAWLQVNFNPGWRYRLWDRQAVEQLVREHYPHYWETWSVLPKDVERSDMAR